MRGFVFALVDPAAPSGFAEEAVADTINRRLAWLRRHTEEVTVLSPLTTFELDEAPLELDAGLEIVELTSEEIASILMFGPQAVGAFGWRLPSAGPEPAMVARTFAVKSTFSMPIVVDGGTEEQIDAKVKADDEALKNAENVLLALRLFGRTYVALHSSVSLRNDERGMPEAFQSRTSNLAGLLGGPFGG
jgi:hypothetical protein